MHSCARMKYDSTGTSIEKGAPSYEHTCEHTEPALALEGNQRLLSLLEHSSF